MILTQNMYLYLKKHKNIKKHDSKNIKNTKYSVEIYVAILYLDKLRIKRNKILTKSEKCVMCNV